MASHEIEYLYETLEEVNAAYPLTVPSKIATLWEVAEPVLDKVYICSGPTNAMPNIARSASAIISNWLATKADEYAAKMTAASHYSDLTKGVKVTGKTGHSDMPITSAFADVGNVGQNNTLSDLQQTETSNDMETPVMRLAEIGERLPNFVREFINEFCDRFALWEAWVE